MRIRVVRAGLFLLFAALISVVAPLQPAMSADLTLRNPAAPKSEIKENRDTEKIRQRPAAATPTRREARTPGPGTALPPGPRNGFTAPRWRQRAIALPARLSSKPDHDVVRRRHAPAALQVYRH